MNSVPVRVAQGVSRPPFASALRIVYDSPKTINSSASLVRDIPPGRRLAKYELSFETTEERCLCVPRTSSELMTGWNRLCWRGGRPQIDTELRELIRRMIVENPLWGGPRIHSDFRSRSRASPNTWSSGEGHPARDGHFPSAPDVAAMDLFIVPTIGSMPSSSCSSIVGTVRGSTSQPIRQQSGLLVR
jgi:hypothetical protein